MAKTFRVEYQAPGSQSGLTVNATCKDETHTEVVGQSGALTEDGTTGKYYKDFDVDNADWSVHISDSSGGKCIKHFGKPEFDTHGLEARVVSIEGKVDSVEAKIDAIDIELDSFTSPPMIG